MNFLKISFTCLLWALPLFVSFAQNHVGIKSVSFSAIARGYHEEIVITPDSITLDKQTLDDKSAHIIKKHLTAGAWQQVVHTLDDVSLDSIPHLTAHSNKRAYDGARHGTLSIVTTDGRTLFHTFDNEQPHEALRPLMQAVRQQASAVSP